ncbi:MAG: thioredoxin domain-containing protein [Parcubacteria group bacterium]|nr:thioredoxin domain-containing protein [Parcubacteria group bacterium]
MEQHIKGDELKNEVEKPETFSVAQKSAIKVWQTYAIPGAIIVAGLFIAGAILYSGGSNMSKNAGVTSVNVSGERLGEGRLSGNIRPVNAEDHILGDISAPVKIVEFSDLECPFCKRFHDSMKLVVENYGESGQVAWVYRHFPLDSIHSKARKEAQATECANEIGGNDAFWKYVDRLFEITPSNNNLDLSLLSEIAEHIGLNRSDFIECLSGSADGGKHAAHIEEDFQDAVSSGANGTPYSIIVAPNGKTFPVSGAQSYTALKALIELALKEKK